MKSVITFFKTGGVEVDSSGYQGLYGVYVVLLEKFS